MIQWADHIFVMEDHHRQQLLEINSAADEKIVVLHIPDIYSRDAPELRRLLHERVQNHLTL